MTRDEFYTWVKVQKELNNYGESLEDKFASYTGVAKLVDGGMVSFNFVNHYIANSPVTKTVPIKKVLGEI